MKAYTWVDIVGEGEALDTENVQSLYKDDGFTSQSVQLNDQGNIGMSKISNKKIILNLN